MEVSTAIVIIFVYFLPSILGCDNKNALNIFFMNMLLGWTVIGWIGALVLAIRG